MMYLANTYHGRYFFIFPLNIPFMKEDIDSTYQQLIIPVPETFQVQDFLLIIIKFIAPPFFSEHY